MKKNNFTGAFDFVVLANEKEYRRHIMKVLTDEEIDATIPPYRHPRFSDLTESEKQILIHDCEVSVKGKELYDKLTKLNLRVFTSYCTYLKRDRYLVFEDDYATYIHC
jgi:hypothetical protein